MEGIAAATGVAADDGGGAVFGEVFWEEVRVFGYANAFPLVTWGEGGGGLS